MRIDPLKQYTQLREQLLDEKATLEARLAEINQVLGRQETPAPVRTTSGRAPLKRGPRLGNAMSLREAIVKALSESGPMGRKELAQAVQALGYVSQAKDPLNSMGVVLYAKNAPFKKKGGKFYLPEGAGTEAPANNGGEPRKKRIMSDEARARISAAQKERWARQRKAK